MLQQTQVSTVVGYFNRFVEVFPRLEDLAAAGEDQVLGLWQGLGYYRRARHLHAAARQVMATHDGEIPSHPQTLMRLPGVGRYTAGAIASIAFGVPAPVLDGNVARVLARWFDLRKPIDDPAVVAKLWAIAESLVPARRPGRFNEALMELGALVCTPRKPACIKCPLQNLCRSRAAGTTGEVPQRRPRRPPKKVSHHVVAAVHRGQIPLERRGDKGLWARLWQLPTFESIGARPTAAAIQTLMHEAFAMKISGAHRAGSFVHQTTHRTIRFHLWVMELSGRRQRNQRWHWRPVGRGVDDLPIAVPQRRALALAAEVVKKPNVAKASR